MKKAFDRSLISEGNSLEKRKGEKGGNNGNGINFELPHAIPALIRGRNRESGRVAKFGRQTHLPMTFLARNLSLSKTPGRTLASKRVIWRRIFSFSALSRRESGVDLSRPNWENERRTNFERRIATVLAPSPLRWMCWRINWMTRSFSGSLCSKASIKWSPT